MVKRTLTLELAKALVGAEFAFAFRWAETNLAAVLDCVPEVAGSPLFPLSRAAVDTNGGFLLETRDPETLLWPLLRVWPALRALLPAPASAVLVVGGSGDPSPATPRRGRRATPFPFSEDFGVMLVWVPPAGPPPDLEARAAEVRSALTLGLEPDAEVGDAALLTERELLRSLIDSTPDAVIAYDTQLLCTDWNAAASRLTDIPRQAGIGRPLSEVFGSLWSETAKHGFDSALSGHTVTAAEQPVVAPGQMDPAYCDRVYAPLLAADGVIIGGLLLSRDVTARRALEERLRQAQKMEAIGRLAGGVAHDFNNLMTVVRGSVDLLLLDLGQADPMRHTVEEIRQVSDRAISLTQQLLAFGRRQMLKPKVVDLNGAILGIERLLGRALGQVVTLELTLDKQATLIEADMSQVEQILMNLALNARDAMPAGGTLKLSTEHVDFETPRQHIHGTIPVGRFVKLTIRDSGTGMDEHTLRHLFEPFYTTKPQGQGTGLGLATVYGIVDQSGGHIEVEAQVGSGTTFSVFFPDRADQPPRSDSRPVSSKPLGGRWRILVVDDDDAVRGVIVRLLQRMDHEVLVATNAKEALALLEYHASRPPNVVITDVLMPEISGRELAELIAIRQPDAKILYVSGYTADSLFRDGLLDASRPLLQKPFTSADLRHAIDSLFRDDERE